MIKLFKKRLSESEFGAALKECSKTAHKAYERTFHYTIQVEAILNTLSKDLEEKVSKL